MPSHGNNLGDSGVTAKVNNEIINNFHIRANVVASKLFAAASESATSFAGQ